MPLCIASAGSVMKLAIAAFILAWTPTGQDAAWEEDLRVEGDRLRVLEVRIEEGPGSAPMPSDAVLDAGVWRLNPNLPPLPELELTDAAATGGWRLCSEGACRTVASYFQQSAGDFVLSACR